MTVYRCQICSKAFKRNEHLSRHKRSHYSDRPFTCPLCLRSFTRQDTLLRHISSHAKPPQPTRSASSKRPCEQHCSESGHREPISLADISQMIHDTPPNLQQCDPDQDQTPPYANLLTSEQEPMDLPAFVDYKSDIDVPPELCESDNTVLRTPGVIPSGSGRVIEIDDLDPSEVAQLFGSPPLDPAQTSDITRNSASPILDRYQPQGSDSPREPFELPTELFNSTVDLHARKWLKDFCGGG